MNIVILNGYTIPYMIGYSVLYFVLLNISPEAIFKRTKPYPKSVPKNLTY